MRVLWLCNIMMPFIAKELGLEASSKEGWLTGTINRIKKENIHLEMGVCFPVSSVEEQIQGMTSGIAYYGFYEDTLHPEGYEEAIEDRLKMIVENFEPDVIHIFGTEFAHAYGMVKAVEQKDKILVSIQGMCALCANEYFAHLPEKVINRVTFRDWLKQDSIIQQKEKYMMRGEREQKMLREVTHILGRTGADYEYSGQVQPKRIYHHLNETLRDDFYHGEWEVSKCNSHSILVTQADYPIKGFHFLLQALPELVKQYPDLKIHVTGNCITKWNTWKDKVKISSYGLYLRSLIKKNGLENHVIYHGMVTSATMQELMLNANLMVIPSVMENSPNSMGEAMLLGLPVVAARVGGIPSLAEEGIEALFYEVSHKDSLVACIKRIFEDEIATKELSRQSRKRAYEMYDPEENYKQLLKIYREVGK